MSTASLEQALTRPQSPLLAAVRRFVWKEYRMLRGLWLAVAVMAMVAMWAIGALMRPQYDFAMLYFSTALVAAVVYAVGAAATIFSVEHEEETYAFLNGLPTEWRPLYAGKLLVAASSAIALAGALAIVGWFARGFETPGGNDTPAALGMFGVMILEALAWGTLFSILIKRPLVAAIVTLIVGGLTLHIVVTATSTSTVAGLEPAAYLEAIPLRLAIIAVVFAYSVLAARNWLVVGPRNERRERSSWRSILTAPLVAWRATFGRVGQVLLNGGRRRMLARLVWQTWRESWKLLLLPLGVAVVLFLGISAFMGLVGADDIAGVVVAVAMPLFIPALYGAMAFHADQRRGSYRFLAEHAALPHCVWLARHVVWLGVLACIFVIATCLVGGVVTASLRHVARQALEHYLDWGWGGSGLTGPQMALDLEVGARYAISIGGLALFGALVVYGIGQLCSMVMRSEILAAFIAIILTVVVSSWVCVLFLWQLPGWLFLLPIAVGCLLATWFRAPDWLAGRNSWQAWLKPALAVVVPMLLVGLMLPVVRLAQVPVGTVPQRDKADAVIESWRQLDTPEARATASMYVQAASQLESWPQEDYLEPWRKPEFLGEPNPDMAPGSLGEIDEAKIPKDRLEEYIAAKTRQFDLERKWREDAIDLAIEAGKRLTCWFSFNVAESAPASYGYVSQRYSLDTDPLYRSLNQLLDDLVDVPPDTTPTRAIDRFIAAISLSTRMRSGQSSVVYLHQSRIENALLQRISEWAEEKGRSKEDLRTLLAKLEAEFATFPKIEQTVVADFILVRKAIEGEIMPVALTSRQASNQFVFLAYLANDLPWERRRAVKVLDQITWQNIWDAAEVTRIIADARPQYFGLYATRRWLRPRNDGIPPAWELTEPELMTSYLPVMEYRTRVPMSDLIRAFVDNEVYRRATLLRVALALYRLEHGRYPSQLTSLVPDYLSQLPLDPFSHQQFPYEPAGIDLELQINHEQNSSAHTGIQPVKSISANTPLFWSIGSGDARIRRWENTQFEPAAVDNPEGEALTVTKPIAMLSSEEAPWWNEPVLVFPLAK